MPQDCHKPTSEELKIALAATKRVLAKRSVPPTCETDDLAQEIVVKAYRYYDGRGDFLGFTLRIVTRTSLIDCWQAFTGNPTAKWKRLFERWGVPNPSENAARLSKEFFGRLGLSFGRPDLQTVLRMAVSAVGLAPHLKAHTHLGLLLGKLRSATRVDMPDDLLSDGLDALMHLAREEAASRLLAAIQALPEDERVCIERHYSAACTLTEVADELGVGVGVVRGRLRRAKAKLKERLSQ